jgi:hypothetical protein
LHLVANMGALFVPVFVLAWMGPHVLSARAMTGDGSKVAYPLECVEMDEAAETEKSEHREDDASDFSREGAMWKKGEALFYVGLAATLLGSGGLVAGHILLSKRNVAAFMLIPLSHVFLLAGSILSLKGLKAQQDALRMAGKEQSQGLFQASMVTLWLAVGVSSLLFLAFNIDMIYMGVKSMCGDDRSRCDYDEETNETVFRAISISLAASQALLLLSIIPRIIMKARLERARKSPRKDLAAVPFVSYGFSPLHRAHAIGLTWMF